MRVIEYGKLEREVRCPHCKSLLGVTKEDIWWRKDISGTSSPHITCPVCQKGIDVEGLESLRGLL